MLTLADNVENKHFVVEKSDSNYVPGKMCARALLTCMRKTGRAKLEGSPGGRESGNIEEERSRPAKQKC